MTSTEKDLEKLMPDKGSILVTGPPGTGKTRALAAIVKHLVSVKDINPANILILSFNRKWSKILRQMTAASIGKSIWEIPIETIYSFSLDILEQAKLAEYIKGSSRNFDPGTGIKILNSVRQWQKLDGIVRGLDKNNFPNSCRYINSNKYVAGSYLQEVFDFILRAQENLLRPGDIMKKIIPAKDFILAEMAGIYSRYVTALAESGEYNYGLLLLETAGLLERNDRLREEICSKYKYVIVDELQETNTAQFSIVSAIARGNCIFFGNDDQAVYGFRGSVSDNFSRIFRALNKQKRVFYLQENHRSTADLIRLSEDFIKGNKGRIEKPNIPCTRDDSNGDIQVKSFSTITGETGYICQKIMELYDRGVKFEDMAVIVKGLGYQTHLIESALSENSIPFVRRSSRSLLDSSFVAYIIDFLKLAAGEDEDEDGLLEKVLLSDAVDIDPCFLAKIRSQYRIYKGENSCTLMEYMDRYLRREKKDTEEAEQAFREDLRQALGAIGHFSDRIDRDIMDFLMDFLDDPIIGLFKFADENNPDSRALFVNIGDYLASVSEYDGNSPYTDVKSYIGFIKSIEANSFLEETEESTGEQVLPGMVNILSFHQCKGMEFEAVFIPFINKNYLPSKYKDGQAFGTGIFGIAGTEEMKREHTAAEARLFYNGITRAKKYLYVTSCSSRPASVFFKKIVKHGKVIESPKGERPLPVLGSTGSWMLKKKALVAYYRKQNGLKTDSGRIEKILRLLALKYPSHKWWYQGEATANDSPDPESSGKSFSYSALEAYRSCPFKYKIRYYLGIGAEESPSLAIGKQYHEVLQRFFKGSGDFSRERLEGIIREVFESYDFKFPAFKNEVIGKALSDFERYRQEHLPEQPQNTKTETEFEFCIGGYGIKGRIDQINENTDGSMELVDFKSGSSRYSERELEEEIQLRLYRLAVDKDRQFEKMAAKRIRMKYMSLGNEKKAEYFLADGSFDAGDIEKKITGIVSNIKSGQFEACPRDYMTCSYCDYKLLCPRFYGKYD